MVYTDIGFVLKRSDLLNDDAIIHLFLCEHGKISAVAKGIKKVKSRKSGNMDLLNLCKISFASTRGLPIITEVQVIDAFDTIKETPSLVFFLFFVCELLHKTMYEGEEHAQVFAEVQSVLQSVNEKRMDVYKALSYLNCKILFYSGVFPELVSCVICGKKLTADEVKVYTHSGIVHERCQHGQHIANTTIKALRFIPGINLEAFEKIAISKADEQALYLLTTNMVEYTISSPIKSKAYIHGEKSFST